MIEAQISSFKAQQKKGISKNFKIFALESKISALEANLTSVLVSQIHQKLCDGEKLERIIKNYASQNFFADKQT